MRPLSPYKIKVTYSDNYVEEIALTEDGAMNWVTAPKAIPAVARGDIIHVIRSITTWLMRNGGTGIEVEEE